MSYSIFNAKADLTYVIRALAPALLTASSSPTSQENGYLPQVLKAIEYFHEIQSYPHAGHKFDMYPSQNEVHLVDSTRDRYVLSHTMNGYPAELGFRGLDGNRVIVIPSHVGISDIYLTHSQVHQESGEAKISLHVPREFLHAPVGAPMHEFSFAEEGVRHSIRVVLNQVKSSGVLQAQLMINGALMDRPPAESIFIQLPHKSIEDFLEANEAEIIELKKFAENLAEKAESPEDLETLIRGIMTTFSDEANAPYPVSSAVITGFHLVFINPKYFHSEIVKDRIPYGATTEVSETYPSRSFVFIDPNFIPDAFAKGSFDSRIFRNGLLKNGVQAELTRKYSDKGMNTGLEMDKQYWSVHLKYLMKHSPQSLPEFLRVFEEDLRYSSYALGSLYEEVVRSLVSHDKTETYSFMLGKLVSLKKEGIRGIIELTDDLIKRFSADEILSPYFEALLEYADAHTKLKILLKEWLQYRKDTPVGLQNLLKRYLLSYPKASDSLTRWFLSIDGDRSEESLVDDFKDSSELHKVGIWALQHQNNQFFERVTRRFVVLNSMGKYEWIQFATAAISFGNHVAAATCLDRLESIPPNNLVSSFVGLFESCLKSNFLDLLPRVGALILKRSPSTREELSEKMDSFVESSNLTLEQAFICLVFYQEILGETPPPRVSQLIPIFHTGSCD